MSRLFHFRHGGKTACTTTWRSSGVHEPDHKLYIPLTGYGFYDAGMGERELRPDHLYFIPGGRRHRYHCPQQLTLYWVHLHALDHDLDQRLNRLNDIHAWPCARWHHAQTAWAGLEQFFNFRDPAIDLRLQALIAELIATLLVHVPTPTDHDQELLLRLAPAAAWLDEHACSNPGLMAAAKRVDLSPVHFHRLATRCWGETPHARVQRVRLEHARALLRDDHDLSVAAIAERCGFGNPFYLTRAFTQRFGMPPTAYRRRVTP